MIYRRLEAAGIDLSAIALGCWQFAGGEMWGAQEDRDSIATVHAALDAGVTLFDTAEGYGGGKSEEVLGAALQGRRERAIIATKASGRGGYAPEDLTAACEGSLRRLRTDYIDIYQLHWPREGQAPAESIYETVEKLKEQGKIRFFGVCNFGRRDLDDLFSVSAAGDSQTSWVVSDQLAYSLLWRGIEEEIVPACRERGIGIFAYSTLVHGLLSGRYRDLQGFPDSRARTLHFSGDREGIRHGQRGQEELTAATLERIAVLCDEAGLPMLQAAVGWVLHRPGVVSVLAGSRTPEQALQNARMADQELPQEFLQRLTDATEQLKQAFGAHADMWQVPGRIH